MWVWTWALLFLLGAADLLPPEAGAQAAPDRSDPEELLATARSRLDAAKQLGAKRHLPVDFQAATALLKAAETLQEEGPASARRAESVVAAARRAVISAERLLAKARFIKELRDQKHAWQEVADQFEHALHSLAQAARVELDSTISGRAAATALADELSRVRIQQTVRADSLSLLVRYADQRCQAAMAEQESTLTALRIEVSHLRQQLWETELRAGMAEADRSAAESDLSRRREREESVQQLAQDFGEDEGQVLLTPAGDVIIHVFGFSFAVGSAELRPGKEALLDKLTGAVALFPGARLRIEGHTDNTGSRSANLSLSRRRAETVASLLAERLEQPAAEIEVVGFGPDRPIASNDTPAGRARNRRIDVVILVGGG
jgi:outer membrane protein OmpA-like peptidoglycan-associated protein